MENRTIAIANTKTQQRYQIETNATTLGELKAQLTLMGIDFAGMSFTEGITKTTLISDDSLLPTNVSFKGQTTNNLIMLLTNTTKNIPSGAGERTEVYAKIKELGLQDAIKADFGRNFTQVPTKDLQRFVNVYNALEEDDEIEQEFNEDCHCSDADFSPCLREAEHKPLVNLIYDNIKFFANEGILKSCDVEVIAELTAELSMRLKETEAAFSDADIDEVMNSLTA